MRCRKSSPSGSVNRRFDAPDLYQTTGLTGRVLLGPGGGEEGSN